VLQCLLPAIFQSTPFDSGNACVGPSRNIRMAMQSATFPEEYIYALKGMHLGFFFQTRRQIITTPIFHLEYRYSSFL
jgi:hypothetical protein